MRTYTPLVFQEARRQWEAGSFGWRWNRIRAIAAQKGYLYPPSGSVHDDRESGEPSQRAIIWRALEDNPKELERIVGRSMSWSQVVDGIIGLEARLAAGVTERDRDDDWERKNLATPRESLSAIGGVFERVAASLGYVRKDSL